MLLWFGFEFVGAVIGLIIFGEENMLYYVVALVGAALGGFLAYQIAKNTKSVDMEKKVEEFAK